MAIVQAALVMIFGFGTLLTLLFVSLVAGVASADRARVSVVQARSTQMRR